MGKYNFETENNDFDKTIALGDLNKEIQSLEEKRMQDTINVDDILGERKRDRVQNTKSRKKSSDVKLITIIAVAEGAISKEEAKLSKREFKEKMKNKEYPSIAYELAAKIQDRTEQEVRITIPGHMQRGGSPCPYDRVISTRFGAAAAELILNEEYGYMVGIQNGDIVKVPLSEVAGKLKMVNPEAQIIQEARLTGISFGD